jgi:glycerol-3-phosphate acyltransferase PlsY
LLFRYVSLGSMICMFIPAFMIFIPNIAYLYLFDYSLLFNNSYQPDVIAKVWIMCIMLCNSFIIIVRHAPNIQRLLKHEEKRFF